MAMETFAGAYGSEVGVAGLKWIPRGGLYVTGGLTPKNIKWIEGEQVRS
jgi:glucokinase